MTFRASTLAMTLSLALVACGGGEDMAATDGGVDEGAGMGADSGEVVDTASATDMPEWVPAGFPLPGDFSVVGTQDIGQYTHVLDGTTDEPLDGLYESLSEDLSSAGYEVRDSEDYAEQDLVYFDGQGCSDCTIRIVDAGPARTMRISMTLTDD